MTQCSCGWAWIFGLLALLSGCSTPGGGLSKESPPEVVQQAVRDRVNARWAALIRGDMEAAYGFLSPTSRETVSLEAFRARRGPLKWTAASIESIACGPEACKVDLKVTYDYPIQGAGAVKGVQTPLSETWVVDKGSAWLVLM